MTDLVRKTDRVSRYGGEKFLIVYPNSPLDEFIDKADQNLYRAKSQGKN